MAKIPQFASEQEESDFWDTHSITDYLDDTTEVDVIFIDARPPQETISLGLEPAAITRLKAVAQQHDMGYQMLIRQWLMERLDQEAG